MSDNSEDHDNFNDEIGVGLREEHGHANYLWARRITMKGKGRRSILKLPFKTEITIHDCLISQLDRKFAAASNKRETLRRD